MVIERRSWKRAGGSLPVGPSPHENLVRWSTPLVVGPRKPGGQRLGRRIESVANGSSTEGSTESSAQPLHRSRRRLSAARPATRPRISTGDASGPMLHRLRYPAQGAFWLTASQKPHWCCLLIAAVVASALSPAGTSDITFWLLAE